jgi:hypothetical protein
LAKSANKAAKPGVAGAAAFAATVGGSISRDEIYHRLEWYFDHSHNPQGKHTIDPNTPIDSFFQGMDPATGRQVLWVNINKISPTYIPAWRSALFHGVQFPWISQSPIAIGIRDIQSFGNLIEAAVLTYRHFGWSVT